MTLRKYAAECEFSADRSIIPGMDELAKRIGAFIVGSPSAGGFEELALALFARQYERVEPYRRLCNSLGVGPENCTEWTGIPLAPAAAFKRYELSCVPVSEAAAVYHSSGTSREGTSRHFMDKDALALYRTSVRHGFVGAIPEAVGKRLWAMMPSPKNMPGSSLSAMLGMLGAERFFWEADAHLVDDFQATRDPIVLFGTSFAFVQLFDTIDEPIFLAPGSIVIETGGFKGRTRSIERPELYSLFKERLGVDPMLCFSEYGMSEMASQFYSRGLEEVKHAPHWVRTRVIDPLTGADAPTGVRGKLAHYDLANFNSVMAIETEDVGYAVPIAGGADRPIGPAHPIPASASEDPGEYGFVLLGRAEEADLRGCSLTIEELWTSRRGV